jgi:hypothetical protein
LKNFRDVYGVLFDDSTSGTGIRAFLARFNATIIGGFGHGTSAAAYVVRAPDPGATFDAVKSLENAMAGYPGVRRAMAMNYEGSLRLKESPAFADWPRLTELLVLDTTRLVTLPNNTYQLYRTELVIVFEDGMSDASKQSILNSLGMTVLGVTAAGSFFVRFPDRGPSYQAYRAFVDSVRARPGIRVVAPINFTPMEEETDSR